MKTLIWVWHIKVLKFEQYAKKEKQQQQQQQKLCLVCTLHKLAHHEVALWIQRTCKYLLLLVNYKITTFGGQLTSLNILIHISVPSFRKLYEYGYTNEIKKFWKHCLTGLHMSCRQYRKVTHRIFPSLCLGCKHPLLNSFDNRLIT